MLIYSLVMILLAAKLDSPLKRKMIYASVGVIGTIFLNVLRIFIIAYYGYAYAYTGGQLDAFHNSIGEILFPIWIVVFLAIVLQIEGRRIPTGRGQVAKRTLRAHHLSFRPQCAIRRARKELIRAVCR